jgi:catechol 2,3-dioxygenase-like lactoylglutathione lyase family enzyme
VGTYIHSTAIIVSDVDKALEFYIGTLGFEKRIDQPMGPDMRFTTVAPVGAQTEIVLGQTAMFGEGQAIKNGISLVVDDIQATYDDLVAKGVTITYELQDMPWGARGFHFADPDGNEFFVSHN